MKNSLPVPKLNARVSEIRRAYPWFYDGLDFWRCEKVWLDHATIRLWYERQSSARNLEPGGFIPGSIYFFPVDVNPRVLQRELSVGGEQLTLY